jgi:predicted RNase H-like HicB family nuclease
VLIEPAQEGGYVVSVPSLPGCHTQGETYEETLAMAKDAIEGYLECLIEDGEAVPIETPPAEKGFGSIRIRSPLEVVGHDEEEI